MRPGLPAPSEPLSGFPRGARGRGERARREAVRAKREASNPFLGFEPPSEGREGAPS